MKSKSICKVVPLVCALLCGGYLLWGWRGSTGGAPSRETDPHFDPLEHCSTDLGTLLGYAFSVPAFSNCHRSYKAMRLVVTRFGRPDFVLDYNDGAAGNYFSGTPWLSTEYVARFLFHHRGVTHLPADTPQDVWTSKYFYNPLEGEVGGKRRRYEPVRIANYDAATTAKLRKRLAPRFADIVVWPAQSEEGLPGGHVAVVVQVEDDVAAAGGADRLRALRRERLQPQLVYIAEQNFDNAPWAGRNYSRVLRFYWENGKEAVLQDPSGARVLGLVRKGKLALNLEDDDAGDL
ncbi:D-alanyl-glycyl endopeptidase-like protein [Trypanosoma conorhini]|uniref:D-alanyl-glycyl endopeptidase-like protein n=1 Tax=Trypanosoma conorhini TaxID=83891 RepID=A0A3R7LGJ5_9TRYP|nr:D-alanyl-glycyl endopeptidase-like protein [Trypanosoma conorhini]RNF23310.1 D-alanyl-glycyl endopeptidase-like protein [Trypanosoma conorhini]